MSLLGTIEAAYKPIHPVDQEDWGFFIPADNDTYIDLNIKFYVRGKLAWALGKDVEFTDATGVTNNFLHSLFSHISKILKSTAQMRQPRTYQTPTGI